MIPLFRKVIYAIASISEISQTFFHICEFVICSIVDALNICAVILKPEYQLCILQIVPKQKNKCNSKLNMINLLIHLSMSIGAEREAYFVCFSIEWVAVDYDSGLDQVKWRLFDNFTGSYIDHGKNDLNAQGMADVCLKITTS